MKKREQLFRKILTMILVVVMLMADSSVMTFAEVIGNVVEKGNKVEVEEDTDVDTFSDKSETAVFSTQDTFGTDYSLEYLLNRFNVVAFGDVEMNIHCMGAVLIKGNYSGGGSGFSDSANVDTPSYIGGYVSYGGPCNSRHAHENIPLYVGTSNTVSDNGKALNGRGDFNQGGQIYTTDTYVNWESLQSAVAATSAQLPSYSTKTYDITGDWQTIEIDAGTNVSLNTHGRMTMINIKGSSSNATVINVLDSGSINNFPRITNLQAEEDGDNMPIAFNLPNASEVNIADYATPVMGHVIAPNASIYMQTGNYNGCFVGQKMTINGEGHMWPYTGGSLIPTTTGFSAIKTVDGNVPTKDQVFHFNLSEFEDNEWKLRETKTNSGSSVTFSEIQYSSDDEIGDHWYLISEDQTPVTGYTLSTKQYLVKVKVAKEVQGSDTVYNKTVTYYETPENIGNSIPDGNSLTQLNSDSGFIFDNKTVEVKKEKGNLEVTKNLKLTNGNLMALDQTFYVALYSDEACEQRVSDVKEIVFKNNSVSSVKFTELELNKKYYVAECDADGKTQTRGELADGTVYQARFNDGNSVTVTEPDGTQTVYFDNVFMKKPDGFYTEGNLTITKKLVGADGNAKKGSETFYAGIFADENHTTLSDKVSQNIVPLKLDNTSEVSSVIKVGIEDNESTTLYITETDADGKPVKGISGFAYKVSVSADSVVFDSTNTEAAVVITNTEPEKEKKPKETEKKNTQKTTTSQNTDQSSSAQTKSVAYSTNAPKTGDDTPIALYVVLLLAAAIVIFVGVKKNHKKR